MVIVQPATRGRQNPPFLTACASHPVSFGAHDSWEASHSTWALELLSRWRKKLAEMFGVIMFQLFQPTETEKMGNIFYWWSWSSDCTLGPLVTLLSLQEKIIISN